MILKKTKNQKGSALMICISILLFLSILSATNFNTSRSEVSVSTSVYASNILFQASEYSIETSIKNNFENEKGRNALLNMNPNDEFYSCTDYNGSYKNDETCKKNNYNSNKSIKTFSKTTKNKTTECLSYGNSEQKAHCFIIRAESTIPNLDGKKEVHIQEVQINTVNLNNNGVYEM